MELQIGSCQCWTSLLRIITALQSWHWKNKVETATDRWHMVALAISRLYTAILKPLFRLWHQRCIDFCMCNLLFFLWSILSMYEAHHICHTPNPCTDSHNVANWHCFRELWVFDYLRMSLHGLHWCSGSSLMHVRLSRLCKVWRIKLIIYRAAKPATDLGAACCVRHKQD